MFSNFLGILALVIPFLGSTQKSTSVDSKTTENFKNIDSMKANAEKITHEETNCIDLNCFDRRADIILAGHVGPQNDL